MYHQFTANPEGEDGWLRGNYAYIGDFDAHMNHIATTGFYLPTWDELSAFIDGRLFLPNHSVIVTDDDADQTWFDLAAPVVDKHMVLTTSFMITAYRQDPPPNPLRAAALAHPRHAQGRRRRRRPDGQPHAPRDRRGHGDVRAGAGVKEVMAYPFGHHNETRRRVCARRASRWRARSSRATSRIGTDKLAMPTVRIDYGMGLDELVRLIG